MVFTRKQLCPLHRVFVEVFLTVATVENIGDSIDCRENIGDKIDYRRI